MVLVSKPDLHLMLVDGKVVHVDMGPMLERHRQAHIKARAAAIDQAAALLGDPAFDVGDSYDAIEASGLPAELMNSAGNIALTLAEVEHYGLLGED
jgi:hypothetical protein